MPENDQPLKPCPFCGAVPEFATSRADRRVRDHRTILRCTNSQCYLHYNAPTSWHCGDTEEHAKQRLAAWWNNRPGEDALKEKNKKLLETAGILDSALREYQQKYGE